MPISPDSLVRTLMINSQRVDAVIEHPLARAVTVTGSAQAGEPLPAKLVPC